MSYTYTNTKKYPLFTQNVNSTGCPLLFFAHPTFLPGTELDAWNRACNKVDQKPKPNKQTNKKTPKIQNKKKKPFPCGATVCRQKQGLLLFQHQLGSGVY